jgi:hypothetical protein
MLLEMKNRSNTNSIIVHDTFEYKCVNCDEKIMDIEIKRYYFIDNKNGFMMIMVYKGAVFAIFLNV